jgi:hypothetical protein
MPPPVVNSAVKNGTEKPEQLKLFPGKVFRMAIASG